MSSRDKVRFFLFGTWEEWGLEILWYDRAFIFLLGLAGTFIYYYNLPLSANDVFLFIVGFVGWMYGRATIKMANESLRLAGLAEQSLKETRKDRKRPQILDVTKKVIAPFISICETTIDYIDTPYYGWYYDGTGVGHLPAIHEFKVDSRWRTAVKELYRNNLELQEKIENYNKKVPEIEEKFRKVTEDIMCPEFYKICKQKELAFNKGREKEFIVGRKLDDNHQKLITWILENKILKKREIVEQSQREFWNKNRDVILKIREKNGIKQQLLEIDDFLTDLKESVIMIREILYEKRENYRIEYNLTADEMMYEDSI